MAKRPTHTDSNVNRIRELVDNMTGIKDPDDIMIEVLDVLTAAPERSVEPGKLYLFVYNAKTPNYHIRSESFHSSYRCISMGIPWIQCSLEMNQDNIPGMK